MRSEPLRLGRWDLKPVHRRCRAPAMVNFNRRTYSQLVAEGASLGLGCALVILAVTLTKVLQPYGAARHPAKGATADPRQRGLGLAMSTPRRSPLSSKAPVHGTRSAVGHRHWENWSRR